MANRVYSDSRKALRKLDQDERYERKVEVYKPSGQLIAGLFEKTGGDR